MYFYFTNKSNYYVLEHNTQFAGRMVMSLTLLNIKHYYELAYYSVSHNNSSIKLPIKTVLRHEIQLRKVMYIYVNVYVIYCNKTSRKLEQLLHQHLKKENILATCYYYCRNCPKRCPIVCLTQILSIGMWSSKCAIIQLLLLLSVSFYVQNLSSLFNIIDPEVGVHLFLYYLEVVPLFQCFTFFKIYQWGSSNKMSHTGKKKTVEYIISLNW